MKCICMLLSLFIFNQIVVAKMPKSTTFVDVEVVNGGGQTYVSLSCSITGNQGTKVNWWGQTTFSGLDFYENCILIPSRKQYVFTPEYEVFIPMGQTFTFVGSPAPPE